MDAILSNIMDLNGIWIELAKLPPESLHRQAMERWNSQPCWKLRERTAASQAALKKPRNGCR